jgi:ketosteroid isomerase-like protein
MRCIVLTSLLFILAGCNCTTQNEELEAISKVLSQQAKAWNNGDIDGYMEGYLRSDTLRFASGGGVSYGWEITLNRYKKGYPDRATMGWLTFSDIDIQIISNDAAIVFGKWELEREEDRPWGLFTLLFRKTSQGWRIVHDHTSSAK